MKRISKNFLIKNSKEFATKTPSEIHDFKEPYRHPDEFEFSENRPEDNVDKVDYYSLILKFESDARKYLEEMKKKASHHPDEYFFNDFEKKYEKIFNEFKENTFKKK